METVADRMQAAYISRQWDDAQSLMDSLRANVFARRQAEWVRTRQRRVINIEICDSSLAYFNYTFMRVAPSIKITRNSLGRLTDGEAKLLGIDYEIDSDDELADMNGDDVSRSSESSEQEFSDGMIDDSECVEEGFIVDDDVFSDDELQLEKDERKERIQNLERRKRALFSLGNLMTPLVQYSSELGAEFAAVSLKKADNKLTQFPLSTEKEKLNLDDVKQHLVEVAKIVQGSSKTKQQLSKQIKSELQISSKSLDQFMKDCVNRRKSDVDNKPRQVIDSKKLAEAPYDCAAGVIAQLDQIYTDNVAD